MENFTYLSSEKWWDPNIKKIKKHSIYIYYLKSDENNICGVGGRRWDNVTIIEIISEPGPRLVEGASARPRLPHRSQASTKGMKTDSLIILKETRSQRSEI